MTEDHYIFPLSTVLFPGGALPLKIFEQRYIEMTKVCIRDDRPFGVCLIREGGEVGEPAVPETIGCLATIERWDMPHVGLFELLARGGERFRLLERRVAANGLMSGSIERLPADTPAPRVDAACLEVLKLIIDRVGRAHFPEPLALDDATWVGCRLAEVLPLDAQVRQTLLEVPDAAERLDRLREILIREGLVVKDDNV
ncbi:MAG: ATP-dependent protease La domain protein [Betaproteobacteria bacterium]|nr:ATP-dependent protease La domain protein [Betaproteobacteria bacterium]